MNGLKIWSLALVTAVFAVGCSEEGDDTPPPASNTPTNFTPTVGGATGVLAAIKVSTETTVPIIGTTTTFMGMAVAAFPDGSGYLDAGTVQVNGTALTKQSNNTYVSVPSATNITGIDFDGGIDWSVAGSTSVTGFTHSQSSYVPEIGAITGAGTTVDVDNNVTIGIDMASLYTDISGADSLYFGLYGPGGDLVYRIVPNNSSNRNQTFTPTELSGVGKGSGYIQIAAWDIEMSTKNGEDYAFIREGVITKSVTFD